MVSLHEALAAELRQRSHLAMSSLPQTIRIADGDGEMELEIVDIDRLSCAWQSLRIYQFQWQQRTPAELLDIAQQLASRAQYLVERLVVQEVDAEQGVVQLRSDRPEEEGATRRYFEAYLSNDGRLVLQRFEKSPGESRHSIPATTAHELVVRLCQDIAAIARSA